MHLSAAETQVFVELAFDTMMGKAELLGDEVATVPELDGANSVFALVTHCVGVGDFWFGHVLLGEESTRDRDAEFVAVGTIDELRTLVGGFLGRLPGLLARLDGVTEPARPELGFDRSWPWTVGAVVLHVIEELFQHAGHVDITADLVSRPTAPA